MGSEVVETDAATVEAVYDVARDWVVTRGGSVDASSVVRFVVHLIAVTQRTVTEPGRGPYKKAVVLTVLRRVLRHDVTWGSDLDRANLMLVAEMAVPSMIDAAVGIARGDLDLGKRDGDTTPCCAVS